MYPNDQPGFRVTVAVAVVIPGVLVAARGVEVICCEGKFSLEKYKVTVVPAGTFVPWISTVSGELEFTATSGTVKLPVGLGGSENFPSFVQGWRKSCDN
jgi:hypothetical protein